MSILISPPPPPWRGKLRTIIRFEDAQEKEDDNLTFAEYEKKREKQATGHYDRSPEAAARKKERDRAKRKPKVW